MLDFYSIKGLSRKELEDMLYKEANIQKTKKSAKKSLLDRINLVYTMAISQMKNSFLLKIPQGLEWKKWDCVEDFLDFMENIADEKNQGYSKVVNCAILKTMSAVEDIIDNPIVTELEKNLEHIVDKIQSIKGFKIISRSDRGFSFVYNSIDKSPPIHIRWQLVYRTKQFCKILQKLIYNRKYISADLMTDLIGFRVEIDDMDGVKMSEDNILFFAKKVFEGDCKLDNKWLLWEEFLGQCGIGLRWQKAKDSTPDEFKNASLIWHVSYKAWNKKIENNLGVEVQFVNISNKNEAGFNKHEIYDMKKVLSLVARLMGTLTIGNIKVAINEIGLLSGYSEEAILHHLFFPKASKCFKDGILTIDENHHGFLIPLQIGKDICFITEDIHSSSLQEFYQNYPKKATYFNYAEFRKKYDMVKI